MEEKLHTVYAWYRARLGLNRNRRHEALINQAVCMNLLFETIVVTDVQLNN
jgi:hypothetical protein